MGYFPVRYDSRVIIYDRRGFIRLATDAHLKVVLKPVTSLYLVTKTYIVKIWQTNRMHHLPAISCSEQGSGLGGGGYHIGGGGVQFICLVECRLPPLDGYVSVCLVLTIEVYAFNNANQHALEVGCWCKSICCLEVCSQIILRHEDASNDPFHKPFTNL